MCPVAYGFIEVFINSHMIFGFWMTYSAAVRSTGFKMVQSDWARNVVTYRLKAEEGLPQVGKAIWTSQNEY